MTASAQPSPRFASFNSRSRRPPVLPLVWHNLRLIATPAWLAAPILLAAMAYLASPAFMSPTQGALWGERFLSLIALLLFPPLAVLDAEGIGETLLAKRQSHRAVFALRWLLAALYMILLTAASYGLMRLLGATFPLSVIPVGAWITALALGSFGLCIAVFFRGMSGGFLAAFAWYALDWMTKGKLTGPFYLFSLLKGEWNPDKLWLLGLAFLALSLSLWALPKSIGGKA
ncbi:hypothetical protein [Gorillibacterium sp. CAU 1737]|uniref:hypothetical protein n=1 Tax=Gorillibacterium sp. CAU 1737 TaxID=3140362 RepID=UPI003260C059